MHVSVVCGLSFMCVSVLLFLPAKGQNAAAGARPLAGSRRMEPCMVTLHPHITSNSHGHFVETKPKFPGGVAVDCCMEVSKAPVRQIVNECYEQKKSTIPYCKVHAYIFVTESGNYCVDPSAQWLPERLQKLEKRGIVCRVLGGASNSQA